MRPVLPALMLVTSLTSATAAISAPHSSPAPPMPPTRAVVPAEPDHFGSPLPGPREVVRAFDAPETDYGSGHRGVDLAGTAGQPVRAAATGLVVYAGRVVDRPVISIEHPGGIRTTYEPVTPEVVAGERVTRGQRIGTLAGGHPECAVQAPASCLHWGARLRSEYLNPLRLLGHGAVRLLPWHGTTSARR
ncbi:M23 family metallopeptidase [Haloactinomyces albus]|uniref:Murein DD-endopeptidase MepM/ murein hydrolase activator NlpD n=1 Tax=Haloactinomyces albus TaxID=1352928 RepID=A0AAE3ZBY0_9ACTN|nr:M23 family metallopeptidase [Haloactinomyces albus]MDR7300709.1 murein DD-endopeptidase MepM/ murein hydrolase activator NlpD [Haloactinomyces albus]